jgi:valyl-tRNA synthetase
MVVEPLPMLQWFVDTKPLADKAIDAVESGKTRIIPGFWKKTWDHFMYNIRPWCISRQLWWGHQIPAWYCDNCDHVTVSREDATECENCGSTHIEQEEDVLDTWFSSGLWPFSTLGWPDETAELAKFYPGDVLETGFDILFFWVARMMMMGCWFMDEVPFKDVFLHAMVRDQHGQKMSKMKGNIIDPLHLIFGADREDMDEELHRELIAQHPDGVDAQGADALRFTLGIYAAQGRDIKLDIERIEGYRAFLNKMWNAARFGLMNLDDFEDGLPDDPTSYQLSTIDRWILHRLNEVVVEVTEALDEYRFNDYAEGLYHFVWHEFCDWYIEFAKPALYDDDDEPEAKRGAQATLLYTLDAILRLMHPISPFITEDIWKALPLGDEVPESIMVAAWPEGRDDLAFEADRETAELLIDLINAVRGVRGNTAVKPGVTIPTLYLTATDEQRSTVEAGSVYLKRLAKIESIEFIGDDEGDDLGSTATAVCRGMEIRIPLKGLIDVEEELGRLNKELGRVEDDIAFVSRKLDNENFVKKAPAEIVQKERDKLAAYQEERATLQKSLEELRSLG